MKLTIKMQGLDKFSLGIKPLIAAARQGLVDSTAEAADLFVEEARALVPVDTGNLRDHIAARPGIDEPEKVTLNVAPYVEADNPWGIDPAYARRIEFGFVGQDSLGRYYNQAAQPYMRPAFDSKKQEAAALIKEGILQEVDIAYQRNYRGTKSL